MNFQECIDFANQNQTCWLATTDGDQPHVRGFMMWFADEAGFYFHTGASKSVCRQLKENPKIEVCFFAPDPQGAGKMMRVQGEVEFIDDIPFKTALLADRPWLKEIGTGMPDDPLLVVFRIARGEVHFWSMEYNMRESEIERVQFDAPQSTTDFPGCC
ncbi:MAG: pyridoxamine 5'-phosphate oxidase family protein [Chloroflexi bacterium]|nr:pyridoxamine 5'-phosphate oxidase family protein [Chloroflexota bacterium]